ERGQQPVEARLVVDAIPRRLPGLAERNGEEQSPTRLEHAVDLADDRRVVVNGLFFAVLPEAAVLDGRDGHHGVELAARETGLDESAEDELESGMGVRMEPKIEDGGPVPQAGTAEAK